MIQEKHIGLTYFLVHALVEIVCFSILYDKYGLGISFTVALFFDYFAFVPQAIIGELNHRFRKLDIGSIGVVLMSIGIFVSVHSNPSIALTGICILAFGNCMLHEAGAIATVTVSKGKLFPSALFVSGGSFGLVLGQIIGSIGINRIFLLILMLIIELLVLLSNKYWKEPFPLPEFSLTKENHSSWFVITIAFGVTAVRSFLGYAIPMLWKQEVWQTVLLFFIMGFGKAAGGYFSDRIGARKTAVWSTLLSIPFLLIGNKIMLISIVGVCLFSATMSITFGALLSVIKNNPGLAFGVTTLALFVGVVPVLIWGTFGTLIDSILVVALSLVCAFYLNKTLK